MSVATFNNNNSWTPSVTDWVDVEAIGSGGGGAANNSTTSARGGGGGGGGAKSAGRMLVMAGVQYDIVVGPGGASWGQ